MSLLKVSVNSEDHFQGRPDALLTLVEYGDYECPYCALAYPIVKQVQEHFDDQLKFVFRNFPLREIHPHAMIAAQTAEFAGAAGRFWEMHDALFENQTRLSIPLMLELAAAMGLSSEELKIALEEKTYEPKIKNEFLGGVRSGVNGTPTFFINNSRYDGHFETENLISALTLQV